MHFPFITYGIYDAIYKRQYTDKTLALTKMITRACTADA